MGFIKQSLLVLTCLFTSMAIAAKPDDDFVFPDDDLAERIAAVNDGSLRFIEKEIDNDVLLSENIITITASSLSDGWVKLQQCYQNLDPIGKVEIIYQYKGMKNLAIVSHSNIASARLVNETVQLEDVEAGARLCVSADIRNLYKQPHNTYTLINGPYHRKFFDGYYPLNVQLEIVFPHTLLKLIRVTPVEQPGFKLGQSENRLIINALFEGKLITEVTFSATGQ